MSVDQLGTQNLNQMQASKPLVNEAEKQINPSVKFNPRQDSRESQDKSDHSSQSVRTVKTIEDAPTIGATRGGL